MRNITERDFQVYLSLMVDKIISGSRAIGDIAQENNLNIEKILKQINDNPNLKYLILQAVDWYHVLHSGSRKHIYALLENIGLPNIRVIPRLGENTDFITVKCFFDIFPEIFNQSLEDVKTGEFMLYDVQYTGLNICDVALASNNYKIASFLINKDIIPSEEFYHHLLNTPRTTDDRINRIAFIAEKIQLTDDELKIAVEAQNPPFVDALLSFRDEQVSADILKLANKKYEQTVKQRAQIYRDTINKKGLITELERELKEINKRPNSQKSQEYYQNRLREIPLEIERIKQLASEYDRCFKKPQNCISENNIPQKIAEDEQVRKSLRILNDVKTPIRV
jgi:tetratricopeptide (TPR) repeat protein